MGVSTIELGLFENLHSVRILARIFDRGVNNYAGTLPERVFSRDPGQDLR